MSDLFSAIAVGLGIFGVFLCIQLLDKGPLLWQ